jgi:hypothetical protein
VTALGLFVVAKRSEPVGLGVAAVGVVALIASTLATWRVRRARDRSWRAADPASGPGSDFSSNIPPVRRGRLFVSAVAQLAVLTAAWTALRLALGDPGEEALIVGTVYGVMWTCFNVGVELYRRKDRLRADPFSLGLAQRRAALDASVRGPVPADPQARREALRLVSQAEEAGMSNRAATIMLAVATVGGGVAGVLFSRWWWLVVAIVVLAAALTLLANRRDQAWLTVLEDSVLELEDRP